MALESVPYLTLCKNCKNKEQEEQESNVNVACAKEMEQVKDRTLSCVLMRSPCL